METKSLFCHVMFLSIFDIFRFTFLSIYDTTYQAYLILQSNVFLTNSKEMCQDLKQLGVSCTLILDSAVGYVMEQVDMVMVGAEGVAESGGVINKIGTYTMAMCAQEIKKPFYVLTESFKFSRIYPLNQVDLPNEFKYTASTLKKDLRKEHPLVDYTPPHFINLLFTDLGILTPSAVSDELIKLYL